jgi:hypothetical protein
MRFTVGVVAVLFCGVAGCGPFLAPMAPRLEPEQQATVDRMWDNLLTPVQRVDRTTLLDANVAYWMFEVGVERMHMTSTKYYSNGSTVMEMDCDRANPDVDQFTITVLDKGGRTVRRERYTRAEVEQSSLMMRGGLSNALSVELGPPTTQCATRPASGPASEPAETAEMRALRLEAERRQAAAAAATQPARLMPAPPNGDGSKKGR